MKTLPRESQFPVYLFLDEKQWEEKLKRSRKLASPCILCGRRRHALRFGSLQNNGTADKPVKGVCGAREKAVVASAGPHFVEYLCKHNVAVRALPQSDGTSAAGKKDIRLGIPRSPQDRC